MAGTIALLVTLAAVAIPIVIVWQIVRRVREVSSRLGDPARLQRVFAAAAAAALRKPDVAAPIPPAAPLPAPPSVRLAPKHVLHRAPRPRRQHVPAAPLAGFEMGDRFRLAEPPEISEPHGPLPFSANWLAAAALAGAAAYYLMR